MTSSGAADAAGQVATVKSAAALPSASATEPAPAGPLLPVPADTLIQLERTACFGNCPTYVATIQADGTVFFKNQSVEGGCASFKASRAALVKLVQLIRTSGYFGLKPSYSARVTDHPSAKTFVMLDGRTHRIDHYLADSFAKPGTDADERKRLSTIEKEIDAVANSDHWLKRAGSLPDAVLYTSAQIEAVAAKNAARLASQCSKPSDPRGSLEIGISIDGSHHAYGSEREGGPWYVGRAGGGCSSESRHPAMSCACREIWKWTFPPGCGTTQVRLRIDFDSDPPKITAGKPAQVPRGPQRSGPRRNSTPSAPW